MTRGGMNTARSLVQANVIRSDDQGISVKEGMTGFGSFQLVAGKLEDDAVFRSA